nr:hypothetical protein [uncultured Brumimicrobium sp.]
MTNLQGLVGEKGRKALLFFLFHYAPTDICHFDGIPFRKLGMG